MLAIWSLVPLPFLKPAWTSGSSQLTKLLKPGLENFEHYFTSMWDECNCALVWAFFGIAFHWNWNENWLFPDHCWIFKIWWHIEWSTFIASSFRIWNSLTGIPSPPLALFVMMLPKAHLTLHSSDHTIVVIWIMKIFFLYSSSVYSCHLFLMSSASVRPLQFLSFIVPIFAWNVPLVSNFLEEISSLSHSTVSLYFFALITEEGFFICPCYSLELCIQMCISFLFSFAFSFCLLLSYLLGLLGQPFFLFPFLFLGDGLDHCLLYTVTNFYP